MNNSRALLLDIVVLTKDNIEELKFTLDSLPSVIHNINLNVYIIDGSLKEINCELLEGYKHENINLIYINSYKIGVKGIYPSMNLALQYIQGDWMIFMNSGDCFSNSNIINSLYSYLDNQSLDLIFGKALIVSREESFSFLMPSSRITNMRLWLKFFEPCHQSIFVRTNIARNELFTLSSPYGADSEWKRRLFDKYRFIYIPICISEFYLGGISTRYSFIHLRNKLNEPTRRLFEKIFEILKYFLYNLGFFNIRVQYLKSEIIGYLF